MGKERDSASLSSDARAAQLRAGFAASMPRLLRTVRETVRIIETSTNDGIRGRALVQLEELLEEMERSATRHGIDDLAMRARALMLRQRRHTETAYQEMSQWPEAKTLIDVMTRVSSEA